jgi:regulator of protease activity HflC (stomatin/prohibitin superfamily)
MSDKTAEEIVAEAMAVINRDSPQFTAEEVLAVAAKMEAQRSRAETAETRLLENALVIVRPYPTAESVE